jgi:hypothetical protein
MGEWLGSELLALIRRACQDPVRVVLTPNL